MSSVAFTMVGRLILRKISQPWGRSPDLHVLEGHYRPSEQHSCLLCVASVSPCFRREDAMRSGMRMLLGLALLAHGLGNAVLPLRGLDWVAAGSWSYPLVLVYLMAII